MAQISDNLSVSQIHSKGWGAKTKICIFQNEGIGRAGRGASFRNVIDFQSDIS